MQSTLKSVLELADDVKVSQLVIRLWRTKDELLATMRTPWWNPLRWALNKNNTIIKDTWEIITKFSTTWWDVISSIKFPVDEILMIKEVSKWWATDMKVSSMIYDQMNYVWKDLNKIQAILLDNVKNGEILDLLSTQWQQSVINNIWNIWWLDKMAKYVTEKLGKSIDTAIIYTERDMYGDVIYDIKILLK